MTVLNRRERQTGGTREFVRLTTREAEVLFHPRVGTFGHARRGRSAGGIGLPLSPCRAPAALLAILPLLAVAVFGPLTGWTLYRRRHASQQDQNPTPTS